MSGAIMGGLTAGSDIGMSIISGALQSGTVKGVEELGKAANLDPNITHLAGMMAGSLVGGMFTSPTGKTFSYTEIMNNIAPDLIREATRVGVLEVGEMLGMDSRMSSILSSVGSVFASSLTSNVLTGRDIGDAFSRSINSAVVSYGVSFLEDVNPAFSAIRSIGLMNALENTLNEEGLFNGVFNILNRVASSAINTADNLTFNIFSGARTFGQLKEEEGVLDSVDSALNSIFTQKTINAVEESGGVENILSRPMNSVMLSDGSIGQEMILTNDASMVFDANGEIALVRESGITCAGSFIWTESGGVQLKDGTVQGSLETGYSIWGDINNGTAREIRVSDINDNDVFDITPDKPNTPINISSTFNSVSSEFTFSLVSAALGFANSYMYSIRDEKVQHIEQKVNAISAGSLFNDTNKFLYALANGIRNPSADLNTPPQYINNLEQDIQDHSSGVVTADDILPIALYHGMISSSAPNGVVDAVNGAIDAIKWLVESQNIYRDSLVTKVQTAINAYFAMHPADWSRPIVGMGYSGGFMPLIEGVSGLMYNVKTIVGLGGPSAYLKSQTFEIVVQILQSISDGLLGGVQSALTTLGCDDSFIGNFISAVQSRSDAIFPFLKEILHRYGTLDTFQYSPQKTDLIVNVWGTEDIFHKIGVVDVRENFLGKLTYNIEIVGAGHGDYMRRFDTSVVTPEANWNNTVASFVTDLMLASNDTSSLQDFINIKINQGEISPLDGRGVYVVHLPGSGM